MRTFFLMPYDFPGALWANCEFSKVNIISRFSNKKDQRNPIEVASGEDNRKENSREKESIKRSCFNPTFLIFSVVFAIYSTRIKSIQGWINPWLTWSYSKIPADVSDLESHISSVLEIYGYLLFASPIFATFPELLSMIGKKINRNGILNGEMISLILIMVYSGFACAICSGQMIYKAKSVDDNINAYALIIIFSVAKTIVYASPHLFLMNMFPAKHYATLYGILIAPGLITMWLIDPLFRLILGDSYSIEKANFAPVSIGFTVICGICLIHLFIPKVGLIQAARKISYDKKQQEETYTGNKNNGYDCENNSKNVAK